MSTFLCLPDAFKDRITNIRGLWGNPNGNVRDDYMRSDGSIVKFYQNGNRKDYPTDGQGRNYCRDKWCVKHAHNSLFTYEVGGKTHADYDTCNHNRRLSDVDTLEYSDVNDVTVNVTERYGHLSDEIWEICESANLATACFEDAEAFAPDLWGAQVAAEAIKLEGYLSLVDTDSITSDAACCSTNYKYCMDVTGTECPSRKANSTICASCLGDGVDFRVLPDGDFAVTQGDDDWQGCLMKAEACTEVDGLGINDANDACCPGLECTGGVCAVPPARRLTSQPERRRLHEEWTRPDRPEGPRNVKVLRDEL